MSEYYGKTAFGMTEVHVKQPPPKPVPLTKGQLRKAVAQAKREHRAVLKDARKRIRSIEFGRKLANANARGFREDALWSRKAAKAHRKELAYQKRVGRRIRAIDKQALKQAKQAIRSARASLAASNKALRAARKAASPRARMAAVRRSRSTALKAANFLWMWRKLKQLTKKRGASDFRNHGFTGSGKGGLTGRRGFFR